MISSTTVVVLLVAQMVALLLYKNNSGGTFRSIFHQTVQYYGRPHAPMPSSFVYPPITDSKSLWNGTYMMQHPEIWSEHLTSDNIKDFEVSIDHFLALNKSLEYMTAADYPVSDSIAALIAGWKTELTHKGRGFVVVKDIPVRKWSMSQIEVFYAGLGHHMGVPGSQDTKSALLGQVRDIGADIRTERQYKSRGEIVYHCDAADVVGLLCLYPAKEGGESRIISSTSVYNELLKLPKGQQYVHRLYQPALMDTRGTAHIKYAMIRPFSRDSDGVVRIFYHMEYFHSAYRRYPSLPPMDEETREALQAMDTILAKDEQGLHLDMNLQPGDLQLISNHYILHSRTEFTDYSEEERAVDPSKQKRHLLRLWVSADQPTTFKQLLSKRLDQVKVLSSLIYAWVVSQMSD